MAKPQVKKKLHVKSPTLPSCGWGVGVGGRLAKKIGIFFFQTICDNTKYTVSSVLCEGGRMTL